MVINVVGGDITRVGGACEIQEEIWADDGNGGGEFGKGAYLIPYMRQV